MVLCTLPYDDPSVVRYLERQYADRLDRSLLAGGSYVVVRCTGCGLLYQREVPDPALLAHVYGDATTITDEEIGARRGLDVRVGYARQIEQAVRYLGLPPHRAQVLDFGAGYGHWLRMADAYGCQVTGTELDPTRASSLVDAGFDLIDPESLPRSEFHLINAEQVVEHLVDPLAVVTRLAQALRPGGILRIGVPNGTGVADLLADPDWDAPKGSARSLSAVAPLEHLNCFDSGALVELGRRAGLRRFRYPLRTSMHPDTRIRDVLAAVRHRARPPAGTAQLFTRR
jgi:SAM-dependent methyltransferase